MLWAQSTTVGHMVVCILCMLISSSRFSGRLWVWFLYKCFPLYFWSARASVCAWHCEQASFCVEFFCFVLFAPHRHFHLFIHSFIRAGNKHWTISYLFCTKSWNGKLRHIKHCITTIIIIAAKLTETVIVFDWIVGGPVLCRWASFLGWNQTCAQYCW